MHMYIWSPGIRYTTIKCVNMGSTGAARTLVCVKQVKQQMVEEWDECMPLPGDIIEGVNVGDEGDALFIPVKGKSDLSSQLGKISRKKNEEPVVWLKVRRGTKTLKLRVLIVPPETCMLLQTRFTVRAASSDKHVAVLADLTFEQCSELQEMSRRVVNVEPSRCFRQKAVKYDWRTKTGVYLPDPRSTVISSILFAPLTNERDDDVNTTTARAMAWFSAAVSSGIPLVFVNIQTEQVSMNEKCSYSTGKEKVWGRQQDQCVLGIRLWFLPGVAEMPVELVPRKGETRFGMEIKRTEEGFVCIYAVSEGSAAERAGLRRLCEKASETGHIVVMSRLLGKSLMPTKVNSDGLVHCCDHSDIRDTLIDTMDQMDNIEIHIMS